MSQYSKDGSVGLPLKAGVGLRSEHFEYVSNHKPAVPWFEILVDNYLGKGGSVRHNLFKIAENYPLSSHGVGMSLGSTDPLNMIYLGSLKQLIDELQVNQVSEHLSWTSKHGLYSHELLPLPYTPQAAKHIADRISQVQCFLKRQILIENVSSYMSYQISEMQEWEFLTEVVSLAGCGLLLDVNNIYVSAMNHGFDPYEYLQAIPHSVVKEIHLAGFERQDDFLLDTHGASVDSAVWDLYQTAIIKFGAIPTLIEWDNNIPEFDVLLGEASKAQKILDQSKTGALHVSRHSKPVNSVIA